MSRIDLHMHSVVSADGEFKPKEIVLRARDLGMKLIAIADHDSVSAIDEELEYADKYGIKCLRACEFSTIMSNGTELHILGYNINHHDKRLIEREKINREKAKEKAMLRIEDALALGFKFNKEEVLSIANDGRVTSEMIGEVILKDHRNDNDERLFQYREGPKSKNPGFEFYRDYYAPGKVCHRTDKSILITLQDVEQYIHSCGGFMVLAHPNHNIKHNLELLDEISACGLDGIEVFSSYHKKEDVDFFYKEALKRNLIMTVGSDFHGRAKPAIEIGSVDCDEEKVLDGLRRFINI